MPYTSKMARERARWMTLREGIAHIEKAEHCSSKAARKQLGEAIADREVDARWPHALHLTRMGDYEDEDIGPPRNMRFWKSARYILGGSGSILDDPACRPNHVRLKLIRENKLHYRSVLIRRDDVERIWPIAKGTANPRRPTAELTDGTEKLDKPSAEPKPSIAQIREFARQVYADPAYNRPNEENFWDIIKVKLPGASRILVRQIIKEPEFKSQRRSPGRQPKK
jgi:hypothetical protein